MLVSTPQGKIGWEAADFMLNDYDNIEYSLENIKGKTGTIIMFICNHCPYVQSILENLVKDVKQLQEMGIGVVAIMSNDYDEYIEDSPEKMKLLSKKYDFGFPYLVDKNQQVAKLYGAVCTPDFFLI